MTIKARISNRYDDKQVMVYKLEAHDETALFAGALLEKWGLVAAMPDGEDSAGRARLRLPTTEEVVTRAFDIAEHYFATSRARGHAIALPDLNEINAERDEEGRASEQAKRA